MEKLAASELILNENGSIYHLNLLPENLADTVILVGDPDRVEKVTHFFDRVDFKIKKREFHTQTGYFQGKRISVVSTGIGTDNIDIVLNELDALVNIDFKTRKPQPELKSLDLVRMGTSGSLHKEIEVDSFLLSEMAVGFDSLLHYYQSESIQLHDFNEALEQQLELSNKKSKVYTVACDQSLASKFKSEKLHKGITGTNVGFYGPQGRVLRLALEDPKLNDKLSAFSFKGKKITNLEMETAGIYGLSKLLGHRAVSLNAIIANRASGKFSENSEKTIQDLIVFGLKSLTG